MSVSISYSAPKSPETNYRHHTRLVEHRDKFLKKTQPEHERVKRNLVKKYDYSTRALLRLERTMNLLCH